MLKTFTEVAETVINTVIDHEIGFSDFLYSEKQALTLAVQTQWKYLTESDNRFKNGCDYQTAYGDLVRSYNKRITRTVNEAVYSAYICMIAEIELKKLPAFKYVNI